MSHLDLQRSDPTAVRRQLKSLAQINSETKVEELRERLWESAPPFKLNRLRQLIIFGAGPEGRRLADICKSAGIEVVAIADDNQSKWGEQIGSVTVKPVSELDTIDRALPVIVASHRVLDASDRLRGRGFDYVRPFALLQVGAPTAFSPHMFYADVMEEMIENQAKYRALADLVADDKSREVLNAILSYRQSLDPGHLRPVLDADDLYAPKGLFQFSDDEVFVDGGSYDGDTINSFVQHVGDAYERIYGFEPDPITYQKLKVNFSHEPRIECIPAGLSDRSGTLRFRSDASRGAIFLDEGTEEIAVTTIDETVKGQRVSYIKMNIEGAEIDALNGAAETIRQWHPRLAISVYHRPSDLWAIPTLIRELNPDYELFLRQHDGGVIETVLYAQDAAGSAAR